MLVLSIGALIVSTYFTSSGVNEWWNNNVSQYLGGATIGACASALITLVINFASKSNLDLGILKFSRSANQFTDDVAKLKENLNLLIEKYSQEISKMEDLRKHYEETLKTTELANKKLDIVLDNQVQIAQHDSKMVANGTAKKLTMCVSEVKENEERKN